VLDFLARLSTFIFESSWIPLESRVSGSSPMRMRPRAATVVVFKVFLYTELAVVVNKYSISSGNALSTKIFFMDYAVNRTVVLISP
jgi:hypothetical protein